MSQHPQILDSSIEVVLVGLGQFNLLLVYERPLRRLDKVIALEEEKMVVSQGVYTQEDQVISDTITAGLLPYLQWIIKGQHKHQELMVKTFQQVNS